jgi:hypothetical protein
MVLSSNPGKQSSSKSHFEFGKLFKLKMSNHEMLID